MPIGMLFVLLPLNVVTLMRCWFAHHFFSHEGLSGVWRYCFSPDDFMLRQGG
jgi:hypothetical protein